jgi:hypothetical protein
LNLADLDNMSDFGDDTSDIASKLFALLEPADVTLEQASKLLDVAMKTEPMFAIRICAKLLAYDANVANNPKKRKRDSEVTGYGGKPPHEVGSASERVVAQVQKVPMVVSPRQEFGCRVRRGARAGQGPVRVFVRQKVCGHGGQ